MLKWLRTRIRRPGASSGGAQSDKVRQEVLGRVLDLRSQYLSHIQDGDLVAASSSIEMALDLEPASVDLLLLAGQVHANRGDFEAALDRFTLAAHYDEGSWGAVAGQADALEKLGQPDRVPSLIRRFLLRNPGCGDAVLRLATLLHARREFDEAVELLKVHVANFPADISALNLLGLTLAREFSLLKDGAGYLRKALELAPEFDLARSNLAWVLAEAGAEPEALALMNQILASNPNDHETRLMRSLALLKSGNFRCGWNEYESRHLSPTAGKRGLPWKALGGAFSGENLNVIVTGEQGLGDQIMFASCLNDLTSDGYRGALECDRRLVQLFQRSFPSFEVLPATTDEAIMEHAAKRGINSWVPMGSLPARYRNEWGDFPNHQGYLRADAEKRAKWRRRLALLGPGPYVGVSWRGGAAQTRTHLRSIPPSHWQSLFRSGAQIISLQYGDVQSELRDFAEHFDRPIQHWQEAISDYDETAALVSELDLVVSVCTAVVHLGGALGRPVWVLVPAVAEWRYLIRGVRMPWYPSVRMFRQSLGEPWSAVMERLASVLGKWDNRFDGGAGHLLMQGD